LGGANVPADLANVVAIAAGQRFGLALLSNGTVRAWGDNSWGETDVPSDLTNVVGIAAGVSHCLALKGNGAVVAWGQSNSGQTAVPAGLSNVVAVAAGQWYSLALKADGRVVVWGDQVVPSYPLTDVLAIAAGCRHALALRTDGAVVSWGGNCYYGYTPVPVPNGLTSAVAIAAGADSSMALSGEALPTARLQSPLCDDGLFRCKVDTIRGRSYRLEYVDSLSETDWHALPPIPGDGTRRTLTAPQRSLSQRFFRVRVQ